MSQHYRSILQLSGGVTPFTNTYSMSFDGIDERFNGASTFSELDGQNKATFSLWVKPQLNQYGILFHIPKNTTIAQGQVLCFLDNSYRVRWSMDTTSYYSNSLTNVITLNAWNHILICIDLTQGANQDRSRVFINGVNQTDVSNLGTRTQFSSSTGSLLIGEETLGYLTPFLGNIDEFAMWVGTDQRANVSDIYNGGVPFDLSTLATAPSHWWRMGDNDTWSGSQWTLSDNIGSYDLNSVNMEEADRVTDVPSVTPFANTYSMSLDGVDDEVSMDFTNTSTTGSISVWVKPTDYTAGNQIICQYVSNAYRDYINLQQRTDGTLAFSSADSGSTRWRVVTDNAVVSNGVWTHIVFSFDGSNGIIYINGSSVSQTYEVTTNTSWWWDDLIPTKQRLGILRVNGYSVQQRYSGNIEEQSVYTSALTSTEVSSIYNNGLPTDLSSQSNILAWYRCGDNDTAPTLTDNIGSNDGTMTNFSTFSTDVPT